MNLRLYSQIFKDEQLVVFKKLKSSFKKKMSEIFSYVDENFAILKKMKYMPTVKRSFIFLTCGPNLIFAICELLFNLIINSSRKNLQDPKTIKLIKDNYQEIGIIISKKNSIKMKKKIISENTVLQSLALNVALNGYEYYKGAKAN